MVTAIKGQKYTLEEYFEFERTSEERFEFWNGHVWSMAGASPEHEQIVVNTGAHLRELLRGRKCSVFGSNLRVFVPAFPPYRYPDLSALCGKGIFDKIGGIDVLTNPQMIVEVLSPTTEGFDRGDKFSLYKTIPSLVEYLLISTNRPRIVQYIKSENEEWIQREASGLDGKILSANFGIEILLSEVFLDIEFPEPPDGLFLVSD